MSNRKRTRMSRAELDRLNDDWARAEYMERLAAGEFSPRHYVTTAGGETAWCSCPVGSDHADGEVVTISEPAGSHDHGDR
jgi:hypothetical protein